MTGVSREAADHVAARHLFIVSRDKPWLYDYLVERFADDPKVTVILDRRHPVALDRRRTERRVRPETDVDELATQGYVIVDL